MDPSCKKSEFYPLRLLPERKTLQNAHGEAEPFFFRHAGGHHGRDDPNAPNMWSWEQLREEDQVFVGAVIFRWELLLTESVPIFLCNKHQEVSIFNFCKGSMWEIRVPAPWKKLHIFSTSHQPSSFLSAGGRRTGTLKIGKKKAINKACRRWCLQRIVV